ncbi:MAG: hypothetical protein IE878_04245 [Epsilonproteobacteria bacterium]|nr:hypothetical protein [Campylobacterota bacterium]MBD3839583.1 hypothetical protein [Campylobacterota bacterium]
MPKRKEAIKYLVYDAITKSTTTIDATFGKLLDNIYFKEVRILYLKPQKIN